MLEAILAPLALKGNSPVRGNVGFADKRVAAPAKGDVKTIGFDWGDSPLIGISLRLRLTAATSLEVREAIMNSERKIYNEQS